MSNPQQRVGFQRSIGLAPPSRTAPPPPSEPRTPDSSEPTPRTDHQNSAGREQAATPRPIGKRQGNRRCIGFFLSAPTQQILREQAETAGITIAEAVLLALQGFHDSGELRERPSAAHARFPVHPRTSRRRGLERPSTIYGLFTDAEAVAIARAATQAELTVSALVSCALEHVFSSAPISLC